MINFIFSAILILMSCLSLNSMAAPFENTMAQRAKACTNCHGDQGRAGPDGYYPRLAGKPVGYLYNQLRHIRDGRRHYAPMAGLLEPLSNAFLMDLALYFSKLDLPYPAPAAITAPPEVLARGRTLALFGDARKDIAPCQQCHGERLTGAAPNVPALLGLPRDYLNAQLGGWRTGQRRSESPDCMAHIAKQLSTQDVAAVSHWLAAQPVPSNSKPLSTLPTLPAGAQEIRCASPEVNHVQAIKTITPTLSAQAEKGAYLARVGSCETCHTAVGGVPYAGQRPIETPFGVVFSSNLTPDKSTGLGQWHADDFWQALHHGKSKDGRLLSPAFPYTSFTYVTRADSDALFAYLQTLQPVHQPRLAHQIQWPLGTQAALAVWQALFFKVQALPINPTQSSQWNRGAYLVEGLGHCGECHTPRHWYGAKDENQALRGALISKQNWFAPSLRMNFQGNTLQQNDWVSLLKTGQSALGSVNGPMTAVVQGSTQHMTRDDLTAMVLYLQSIQRDEVPAVPPSPNSKTTATELQHNAALYERHCASCHGTQGEGVPNAYPQLAQNHRVQLANSSNLIQLVLHGGFAPLTQSNPQPYGMPVLGLTLSDQDIARVLTYIRTAWGNHAAPVSQADVKRLREHQLRR
jgi:cytochrome c553